jgi:5'-methylthioadenosine phosphorylase
MSKTAEIGVIGGSGFYGFAESDVEEIELSTPFGVPSDKIAVFSVAGKTIAFVPRHGKQHSIPPHKINYRANLWAMRELGVNRIISASAVGSLKRDIAPGDFVINDQFVDLTKGRPDTFYEDAPVTHVSTARPYCPQLRSIAIDATEICGVTAHGTGTVVTIQGPRFSTSAESRWFSSNGWDIIGMTQCPEVALARELALCYCGISLVTDYDAGVTVENAVPVEASHVYEVLRANVAHVKRVIHRVIADIPNIRACACADALNHAQL